MFSELSLQLIVKYEGFSSTPYICPGGIKTIGFGTTNFSTDKVTRKEALALLKRDLEKVYQDLYKHVKVTLTTEQEDALGSFIYNLGITNFASSTLLKKINNKEFLDCPQEFIKWRLANGQILRGLLLRRLDEAKLFLTNL